MFVPSQMFVKGYSSSSIVCTLPQAQQPPSTAFNHPPPFKESSRAVIDAIDLTLSSHVEDLVREAALRAVKVVSGQSSTQASAMAQSAAAATPFNAFPAALKIGDRVKRWSHEIDSITFNHPVFLWKIWTGSTLLFKRGPSWSVSGHQNEDRRGEGSVIGVSKAPSILIQWVSNPAVKQFQLHLWFFVSSAVVRAGWKQLQPAYCHVRSIIFNHWCGTRGPCHGSPRRWLGVAYSLRGISWLDVYSLSRR